MIEMKMAILIKSLKEAPELRNAMIQLIEGHFPKGSSSVNKLPIEDEFFLLLDPNNASQQLVAFDDQRKTVLATVSYRSFRMQFPFSTSYPLDVIGIGLVVTHPTARSRGLSKQLQLEAESRGQQMGASLAVLWSELQEFYEKLNYAPFGQENQWELHRSHLRKIRHYLSENKIHTKSESLKSFKEMHPLYASQAMGPHRSSELYQNFFKLTDVWSQGVFNEQRELKGYALRGKARDLRTCIHELIGDKNACLIALADLLEALPHQGGSFRLQLPASHPVNFTSVLGPPQKMVLAFGKILRPLSFCNWLMSTQHLKQGLTLTFEEKQYQLKYLGQKLFSTEFGADILQLFMGPLVPNDFDNFPLEGKQHLSGYQIPPFYFWGMDSV